MARTIKTSQSNPSPEALDAAGAVLLEGGCVVLPTDSVYGIGAAATPGNLGHERIFAIKRRDRAQTLPLLIADASDLGRYAKSVSPQTARAARALWPGALTLVVRASSEVPEGYQALDGTVALRVPDSALVRALARRVGALAVTSANTHGAPSPASFSAVEREVLDGADLAIDAGACPVGSASTIISVAGRVPHVLREGSVSLEAFLRAAE